MEMGFTWFAETLSLGFSSPLEPLSLGKVEVHICVRFVSLELATSFHS